MLILDFKIKFNNSSFSSFGFDLNVAFKFAGSLPDVNEAITPGLVRRTGSIYSAKALTVVSDTHIKLVVPYAAVNPYIFWIAMSCRIVNGLFEYEE